MSVLRRHWPLLAFFFAAGAATVAIEITRVRASSSRMIEEIIVVFALAFLLLGRYEPPRFLTSPFPSSVGRLMAAVTVVLIALILLLTLGNIANFVRELLLG